MNKVTLIYGDGIGKEVIESARRIVDATGANIEWEEKEAGLEAYEKYGAPLSDDVLESIQRNKVALKGPTATPIGTGFRSVNVEMRKRLNLYANVRPLKSFKGIKSLYDNIDLVIVRENTEGLYVGIERMIDDNKAEALKIISREASERIVNYAFDYAEKEGKDKVTAVHKANIMKLTDGLFLNCAKKVAGERTLEFNDKIIDAFCMDVVLNPYNYQVVVAPNFYGDIISDLASGLVGGLGVAPGANIGDGIGVFEAVHGSAPDIAGKNIANPTSAILSAAMMLRFINLNDEADQIEQAVRSCFEQGQMTAELGGCLGTTEFTDQVIEAMKSVVNA